MYAFSTAKVEIFKKLRNFAVKLIYTKPMLDVFSTWKKEE